MPGSRGGRLRRRAARAFGRVCRHPAGAGLLPAHLPQGRQAPHFKTIREELRINPGRAYACGDEKKDFVAATRTGVHPFIVAYGFEDYEPPTTKIGVPPELISRAPDELSARVLNALDLAA